MLMKSPLGWSQHLQFGVLNWITMSDFSPTTFPGGFVSSSWVQLFKDAGKMDFGSCSPFASIYDC